MVLFLLVSTVLYCTVKPQTRNVYRHVQFVGFSVGPKKFQVAARSIKE